MNASSEPAAIVARDLCRSFRSGSTITPVLRGFCARIRPRELTLIAGPSGSGKTTALGILGGLLSADSGSIEVLGEELGHLSPAELERFRMAHCGFVFQGFNLFPALTALEQVELVLRYLDPRRTGRQTAARAALEDVGLASRAGLRPQALSGGEKQRVAIARALVKRPALLFADEPTSALDRENGERIASLLRDIASTHGTAVVAVTHDPRLLRHADRILHIEDGVIVREESPTTLVAP